MKAIVRNRFGSADELELEEIAKPELEDDRVLVRVRAASVNAADWYTMTGWPWVARMQMGLREPKEPVLGTDFAGVVEAVGKDVTDLRPGDEVFGGRNGSFAEYVSARRRSIALKPANVSFEEAACMPIAGLTALQGLRDKGGVQPGQKVTVNGASGGVGTFAVQIAKALGADVTAVCSPGNVERARSLGADRIVDYTREDFTLAHLRYDVIFDVAGNRTWAEYKRVLEPGGTLVMVGAPKGNRVLGPLTPIAKKRLSSVRGSRKAVFFVAKITSEDLDVMRELLEIGKVKPFIERTYDLSETADAMRYFGEGHMQGKIVITV